MAVTVDLAGRNWFKSGWLLRVPCLVHADAWVRDVLRRGAIPEKRGDLAAPVGAHRCGRRIMRVMVYWSKSRWLRAVGTGPELADRRKWHRKLHSKGWQTQSRVPRAVELDRLSCAPLRVDSVLRHHPPKLDRSSAHDSCRCLDGMTSPGTSEEAPPVAQHDNCVILAAVTATACTSFEVPW